MAHPFPDTSSPDTTPAPAAAPAPQPTNNVHDVALILEGGGMRASLTSGVVVALLEAGIHADWIAGISAGASNLVNYVARDPGRARRSFVEFAADPNFGGLRSWLRGTGMFHAEYIYERTSLPDQALPLDWTAFRANPARYRIGAFRADDGAQVFFTEQEIREMRDLMVRVRASSTMPVLMPPVVVDGHTYVDGALGDTGGIPIDAARAEGFEKFLVVLSQERGYLRRPVGHGRFYRRHFRAFPAVADAIATRHVRYNATREEIFDLEREGRAMVFVPDRMPVTNGERDVARLRAAHELGLAQARREIPAWKEFCGLA